MSSREQIFDVVASLQPVIQGVSDSQFHDRTPCTDYTVRDLINHLLGTSEAMRRVGAGEALDPNDPWGTGGNHVTDQWREDLGSRLTALAKAWSQPDAWEGEAMDGAMPKRTLGDMGYVEVFLHGWDLARATGQELDYGDDAARQALSVLDEIGQQGRSQGAFGSEVEVDDDASDQDRALAKSGRDPHWTS